MYSKLSDIDTRRQLRHHRHNDGNLPHGIVAQHDIQNLTNPDPRPSGHRETELGDMPDDREREPWHGEKEHTVH